MAWQTLKHDCALPTAAQVDSSGVGQGSIWTCEAKGCSVEWKINRIETDGTVRWFARNHPEGYVFRTSTAPR
jgi:hypothetical protein